MSIRRTVLSLSLAALALAGATHARAEATAAEPIPAELIATLAPFAVELLGTQFPDPPVKVDVDPAKALGYHVKELVGVVLMPDKNLTAKSIDDVGDKEVPVAVITTKAMAFFNKDQAISEDKLAVVDFQSFKLPVLFLAVKAKGDERTLEIYSKDKTALTSVPLKKMAGDAAIPVQVKMNNIDLEKKSLELVFSLAGAYQSDPVKVGVVEKP